MKKTTRAKVLLLAFGAAYLLMHTAFAADLASSKIGTGTQKLLSDVATFLVILSPIGGGIGAVYNLIRRSMSDEQNGLKYKNQALVSIGCGVAGVLVSGLITVISSYFQ